MKISQDVLDILDRSTFDGPLMFLPNEQLARPLYVAVAKAIECAGGKWNKKSKAHVFDGQAADAVEPMVLTGEITSAKQTFGFFETPTPIAQRVIDTIGGDPGMAWMEPSAGSSGQLVFPILATSPGWLDCYEIQENNADKLDGRICNHLSPGSREHVSVIAADFLSIIPFPRYDRIAMNPPFGGKADIRHVLHAAQFLKPGGRLAAIMSSGVLSRTDKLTQSLRRMVQDHGGAFEILPKDSFKESGTGVNTVIVNFKNRI